jgi:predicted permease
MSVRLDERYATPQQRAAFFRSLIERMSAAPGVAAVGAVSHLPLTNSESLATFLVPGYDNQKDQLVETRLATPGYFAAMGIPLFYGRLYNAEDVNGKHPVVLVNEAFAARYFAGSNAVGRTIQLWDTNLPAATVVGVLGNIRNMKLEDEPPPQVYIPFEHDDHNAASFAIRSNLPVESVVAIMRSAVKTMDPSLAIGEVQTMGDLVADATARRQFQTTLLMLFAGAALFLAAVGFYGLMAYTVKQRTGEIGVRMAMGASRPQIRSLIVGRGMRLVGVGLVIGFAGAVGLTRLLASFLYGVQPLDAVTLVAVPVVVLATTLMACTLPANRAARIDPTEALRSE